MTAKVNAATCAADAGIPVVITRYYSIICLYKYIIFKSVV